MAPQLTNNRSLSDLQLSLLFSLIYFLVLIPLISIFPIGSSTEAREVHVASIMLESGNWVLPLRDGILPSKPPLFHWFTAAIGALTGGVDPFDARLVSLIFACMTLFLCVYIALKFCLHEDKKRTALVAALILGTSYGFLRLASDSRVDMVFCFFFSLAIAAIALPLAPANQKYAIESVAHREKDFLIFYFACIFAVLGKGPLGVVLPLLTAYLITLYHYGIKKSLQLWFRHRSGIYLFLLFAPLWYLLAFEKAGFDFIARQLLFENVERFTGDDYVTGKAVWYYIPSVLRTAFPWSLIFLVYLVQSLYFKLKGKQQKNNPLLLIWFFTGFVFFSLASGKRHAYLVPLFLPMAVFLTDKLANSGAVNKIFDYRVKEFLILILAFIALVLILALDHSHFTEPLLSHTSNWLAANRLLLVCVCFSPLLIKLMFSIFKLGEFWQRDILTVVSIFTFMAVITMTGQGVKNNIKNFEYTAGQINKIVTKDNSLFAIRERHEELLDPVLYYLKREVPVLKPKEVNFRCGAYYVFEKKYRDLDPGKLRILDKYQEIADIDKERPEKTILLAVYDCSPS